MSLSFNPTPFDLAAGLVQWVAVVAVVLVISLLVAALAAFLTSGMAGLAHMFEILADGIKDLLGTSPRRVWALAVHSFREAYRRKTLWVFAVFAVLFMFAGWFIPEIKESPEMEVKVYVSFVLRTITWLTIPVVLLLACWGLPEDIRARSLHTVVTKPVRRHEIVLGRVLGFFGIGGLVLVAVAAVGYIWILRQVPPAGRAQLSARVPHFGSLTFLDREGLQGEEAGVNVGDEVMFRKFVEGNTKARAIWTFNNVDVGRLLNGELVLESSFQSFRTHKGLIAKELLGQFTLVNPSTNARAALRPFENHEFRRNTYYVAYQGQTAGGSKIELRDQNNNPVDLVRDLLAGGQLVVEVACLSPGQFLGMAPPDLFLRMPDRPFAVSYGKGVLSVALLMLMITVLGVMSGCFAKGPVATMLTGFVFIVGRVAHDFLEELTTGRLRDNPKLEMKGRGVLDALMRIPTHKSPVVEVEDTFLNRAIREIDNVQLNILWGVKHLFPDFTRFDTAEYVANSFDVPFRESLLPSLAATVGFCLPWILVGYFSLKIRELEAK